MDDLDYLRTDYAREKMIEDYNTHHPTDIQKDWNNMKQGIDDCCRWVSLELDNDRHHKRIRLNKCIAYFEEAIGTIENELVNLPEDDWREDR